MRKASGTRTCINLARPNNYRKWVISDNSRVDITRSPPIFWSCRSALGKQFRSHSPPTTRYFKFKTSPSLERDMRLHEDSVPDLDVAMGGGTRQMICKLHTGSTGIFPQRCV